MSRFIFPKQSSAVWFLAAAILGLAAVVLAYPSKVGLVREVELGGIRKGDGFLLTAPYPPEMKKSSGRVFLPQDDLVVLEDGVALPVLAPGKKDIELAGWGRFRAGSEEILFSTSDGKDSAGRVYRIRWPVWNVREWMPGILFLAAFAAFGIGAAQLQPLSPRSPATRLDLPSILRYHGRFAPLVPRRGPPPLVGCEHAFHPSLRDSS